MWPRRIDPVAEFQFLPIGDGSGRRASKMTGPKRCCSINCANLKIYFAMPPLAAQYDLAVLLLGSKSTGISQLLLVDWWALLFPPRVELARQSTGILIERHTSQLHRSVLCQMNKFKGWSDAIQLKRYHRRAFE